MIDTSPYIDKLEALKQFISLKVDEKIQGIMVYEISRELYIVTGNIYYKGDYQHTERMRPPTFEEWYNLPKLTTNGNYKT